VEAGAPDDPVKVFFQNPQIRFVMTNLNQYAGDLLAVHFELQYGFIPLFVTPNYEVQLTMGTRVVVGPEGRRAEACRGAGQKSPPGLSY